ncbi:hypothetical protein DR864_05150 [Runella rosea]|uniref:HMA domain-containing protein n=1 Tax=Runella rosea TaxID=2259595 RepID=A0A344TEU2_9BACT|nr:hypothetical protein [Runella rosea]AXE17163.1 hypothetical protein DR864_05150 [Runella rosea]
MEQLLQILVFKTTVKTPQDREILAPLLATLEQINRWTVDCEDCDCVLRVEADGVSPQKIIELVQQAGFECVELVD